MRSNFSGNPTSKGHAVPLELADFCRRAGRRPQWSLVHLRSMAFDVLVAQISDHPSFRFVFKTSDNRVPKDRFQKPRRSTLFAFPSVRPTIESLAAIDFLTVRGELEIIRLPGLGYNHRRMLDFPRPKRKMFAKEEPDHDTFYRRPCTIFCL